MEETKRSPLYFNCDYMEGAHPEILRRLVETNMEKTFGYGSDPYCESAREKILGACGCPEGEVYFLTGGTQTNATVIASLLAPYEGVIAAQTGHVSVHEAGAVEYTGHKVLTLPQTNGKIRGKELHAYLEAFYEDENREHMVMPGMVYISHPTEYGTLYTKEELRELHEICEEYGIPLYLDGARLGYGLGAEGTDVTLPVIAEYCHVFYIGGTKVGAFCGEAVVIPKKNRIPHFFTMIKQHGALLAKGRLLGIQFDTLFTDGLYQKIGEHGVRMAMKLKKALLEKGYELYVDSMTNQQFVILENTKKQELLENVHFEFWENLDDSRTVMRFATSWATSEEDVDRLIALL